MMLTLRPPSSDEQNRSWRTVWPERKPGGEKNIMLRKSMTYDKHGKGGMMMNYPHLSYLSFQTKCLPT